MVFYMSVILGHFKQYISSSRDIPGAARLTGLGPLFQPWRTPGIILWWTSFLIGSLARQIASSSASR